jgi:hypothetical protein
VEADPSVVNKFLFYTGSVSQALVDLCRTRGLLYLEKPAALHSLKEAVQGILDRS